GGSKADSIFGGPGADTIHGGSGHDELAGSHGEDNVNGGPGRDTVRGGPDADILSGGTGVDTIYGHGGADELLGGSDDDVLSGGSGHDLLVGMEGNDRVAGNGGADTIRGEAGDDVLVGGSGVDVVDGGSGGDQCAGDTVIACEGQPADYKFERFLINQAVPAADSSQEFADRIGTVRNRAGIARAFISANRPGLPSPTVHLYYKIEGTVGKVLMDGPEILPENPQESDLSTTFNYVFDETFLEPGTKMYVVVDRGDATLEVSEANNRYPNSGWVNIDTRDVPTLRITVVPVDGVTLSQSQAEDLFEMVMKMHPVADYDIDVRAPYVCRSCTGDFDPNRDEDGFYTDWDRLLSELRVRQRQEAPDRMYHAIVPRSWRAANVAGMAYIGWPAAVSSLGHRDEETIAHEAGHNLNLLHNRCSGLEGNPDDNFPYSNGSIGHWGYDAATGTTYDPSEWVDLMTYCQPEWISDFSYGKVLDYRSDGYVLDAQADGLAPAGNGTVVQFSGSVPANARAVASFEAVPVNKRINRMPVTEISSVEVVDHAAVPPIPGDHRLVGLDGKGAAVTSISFTAYSLDHAPGAQFLFSVEIAPEDLARIITWEVDKSGKVLATKDS
ncbi:calcium-binding protein, partial [Actinomycetota bacterium]